LVANCIHTDEKVVDSFDYIAMAVSLAILFIVLAGDKKVPGSLWGAAGLMEQA
jgi:hypothetical protein